MSRISLRARVAVAFAVAMAVVLMVIGVFLHLRLGGVLDDQLERRLRADAAALASSFEPGRQPLDAALAEGDVAQVIDARGRVVAASSRQVQAPLLAPPELVSAFAREMTFDRSGVVGDDPARFLALRLRGVSGRAVGVVGTTLESRNDAVDGLLTQLLVGIPFAIALASVSGYLLAGVALRPVEAMRGRAASISAAEPEARLPLPRARDEIRRLGETLNEMLDRLEQGLTRERRFAADAGHELRTPLALLRTELDLALRRTRSVEELESALRSASEEVDRLASLADDLLLLARADEEGRAERGAEPVDVDEVCMRVAARFRPRAEARGRAITVAADPALVIVGDRTGLERALGNLVDNALRHGEGTVLVTGGRVDGEVVLAVADEGSGLPADFLPVAFDRFTQADPARAGGSSGLGLAIVSAIATAHGGTARVANRHAGGAVAEIRLPG